MTTKKKTEAKKNGSQKKRKQKKTELKKKRKQKKTELKKKRTLKKIYYLLTFKLCSKTVLLNCVI